MNNFYPAATIILSEICVALLVLSGIMIFVMLRNKRRNRTALSHLTDKVRQNESERLTSLKTMLKEIYHYADDKIDESAAGIINTEMAFYQGLMDTFSSRDGASLEKFDQKIDSILDAYRNLVPQSIPTSDGNDSVATHNSASDTLKDDMAHLTEQNEKLANELNAIKAAMEETNAEFTRAFAGRINKDTNAESPAEETPGSTDDPEDIPDEASDTQQVTPEENVIAEVKATVETEESAGTQQEPAQTTDQNNDDVDDVLKNIDIDFGDINLDDDEEDETRNEASPAEEMRENDIDKAADNIDKEGIDEMLNEASGQTGTDDKQEASEAIVAEEKTA